MKRKDSNGKRRPLTEGFVKRSGNNAPPKSEKPKINVGAQSTNKKSSVHSEKNQWSFNRNGNLFKR